MKILLSLALTVLLCLSLVACGRNKTNNGNNTASGMISDGMSAVESGVNSAVSGTESAMQSAKNNVSDSMSLTAKITSGEAKAAALRHAGLSADRFYRMSANFEKEQKELLAAVEHDEQKVRDAEQEKINLNIFLEAIRECTDLKELTPTLVNTLIKRIEVHNSTKDEHGHKHVPIDIYFTAVGIINIPTEEELIAAMEEMREKPLKSA